MKKTSIIICLLLSIAGSRDSYASLTDGLKACYSFTGNANDESGNGNHGAVVNAVLTADRFGNPNSAYSFNGTNAYIDLPADSFLNNNYTYSAWARPASIPAFGGSCYVISIGSTGGDQAINIQNNSNWTGWQAAGWNNGGASGAQSTDTLPTINTWYHLVAVRDNSTLKLFVNGLLVASSFVSGVPYYGSSVTKRAVIGDRFVAINYKFNGVIDDLRIYDRALSAAEVSALFAGAGSCSGAASVDPIRCYPFSGNANDVSGNAQHGTVTGAALTTDRFGNANSAYNFNGTTSNYITIPTTGLNLNQYSYSAWAYLNSSPTIGFKRYFLLSIGSIAGDQFINYNNNSPFGHGWGSGGYNSTSPHGFIYTNTVASINQWYHVVVTRSAAASKFYVNGALVDSVAVSAINIPYYGSGTLESKIGIRFGNTEPFDGKIDDLRIYDRPLTATEISALYTAPAGCVSGPCTVDATFSYSTHDCVGEGVNFYSVDPSVSNTYHQWNFGSAATPATSTQQHPSNIVYSAAGAYYVTHIITKDTCSDTARVLVTINPVPSVSLTSTAPVCKGTAVNFSSTGSSGTGYSYAWDFGSGASPNGSIAQNPLGITYSGAGSKTITLVATNQFGCFSSVTGSIQINALPGTNAGNDTVICANTSVQIGSSPVNNYAYSWFPSTYLSNTTLAGPVSSPIAPLTQYILTVTDNSTGCMNRDTVTITMLSPLIAQAGPDAEICAGDTVQIGMGKVEGQYYSWLPAASLSNATLSNPIAKPAVSTTYTLSVTDTLGCGVINDEVTIIVHPLPLADAGINDTITIGSSAQLSANGGIQYSWTPAAGLSNWSIYNPVASPTVTSTYTVLVTDIYGCRNSDSVTVIVIKPDFWIPSAFTPNGDGKNDILYAHGHGISGFELGIYNRWGELIFFTKDIMMGWDGKRQLGGEDLPVGAYVYFVKGILSTNELIDRSGLVNLIR